MPDFFSLVCSFLKPPQEEDEEEDEENENPAEDGPTFPPVTGRPTSPPITSRPTSPPVQPTNKPTTGTPTPKPTLKCFANRNELKAAIDTYIANGCSDSKNKCGDIGDKYGLPIGSWCVSAVTDYEQLFYDAATWYSVSLYIFQALLNHSSNIINPIFIFNNLRMKRELV